MKRYDLIVVGAGPAGLSAAIEAAKLKMNVIVFDENENRADSFLNRFINFSVQKNTKPKSAVSRLDRIC